VLTDKASRVAAGSPAQGTAQLVSVAHLDQLQGWGALRSCGGGPCSLDWEPRKRLICASLRASVRGSAERTEVRHGQATDTR
jgi:hypothetical protein